MILMFLAAFLSACCIQTSVYHIVALLLCRSGQLVTVTTAIAHAADPQKTPGGTSTMILFK